MTKVYIIDPTNTRAATCGLMPGTHWFKARQVKDGPYCAVKTQVIEPRDADGELCGDVQYILEIDGRVIPFAKWEQMALFGEEISEIDYRTMLVDGPWTERNYGARAGQKVDVRNLPVILPPGA